MYRHRCQSCPLVFKHQEQLQSHELTHSFRVTHRCDTCSRTFHSIVSLLQHQQDDHPSSEFNCKICDLNFTDQTSFDNHSTSIEHLHKTKLILEDQSGKLQLNDKVKYGPYWVDFFYAVINSNVWIYSNI